VLGIDGTEVVNQAVPHNSVSHDARRNV
jgi:hypothetical protein